MKKRTEPIKITSVEDIIAHIDTSLQYLDWSEMSSLKTMSGNHIQEMRDFLIALKDFLLGGNE